jgi:hypothetical protein
MPGAAFVYIELGSRALEAAATRCDDRADDGSLGDGRGARRDGSADDGCLGDG